MWVGAANDIQEQRQMVQELLTANEHQAALSEQAYQTYQQAENQRETYENLFRQAPAAICILHGPEHRYQFVNPRYQQLFPQRELLGRPVAEALPEIKDQGIIELLDGVYHTGQTQYGNEVEVQLVRDATGALHDTCFNFTFQQFRENDQPGGVMVFAYEVTEFVRARQALEQLRSAGPNPSDSALA